jgi:hypothetical protein
MMKPCKAYPTSDGRVFLNQDEAQIAELEILLKIGPESDAVIDTTLRGAIRSIVASKDKVVEILSTRKPRTPKPKPSRASRAQSVAVKVQPTEGK